MGYILNLIRQAKPALAEAIGTFLLVLVGTSAIVAINLTGQATSVAVLLLNVLAFAGTLGWLVFVFGKYSGGHFNPAVSLYWWLRGQLPSLWLASYLVAQFAGAIVASILVALLYGPSAITVGLGAASPVTSMGPWAALLAEFIGSLFLIIAVTKAAQPKLSAERQGIYVATGLGLGILLSTGVSGGALNPARALAPQLVAASATWWWVYTAGPVAAAVAVGGFLLIWGRFKNQPSSQSVANQPAAQEPSSILLSTEPIVAMATQPSTQAYQPPTISAADEFAAQQAELQHKAQAAADALTRQINQSSAPVSPAAAVPSTTPAPAKLDSIPENPPPAPAPAGKPIQPSFQTLSPVETTAAPTPTPAAINPTPSPTAAPVAHLVTPVKFVEFDIPHGATEKEE